MTDCIQSNYKKGRENLALKIVKIWNINPIQEIRKYIFTRQKISSLLRGKNQ